MRVSTPARCTQAFDFSFFGFFGFFGFFSFFSFLAYLLHLICIKTIKGLGHSDITSILFVRGKLKYTSVDHEHHVQHAPIFFFPQSVLYPILNLSPGQASSLSQREGSLTSNTVLGSMHGPAPNAGYVERNEAEECNPSLFMRSASLKLMTAFYARTYFLQDVRVLRGDAKKFQG